MDNGDYYENGHLGKSSALFSQTITTTGLRFFGFPSFVPSDAIATVLRASGTLGARAERSERGCAK
jgi:hypothetical protein